MTQLRRKHLSAGTYFIWRCKHRAGQQDRVSDRNDGPNQEDCEVELIEKPDYAHVRTVAHVELSEVVSSINAFQENVSAQLQRIVAELSSPRVVAVQHRNASDNGIYPIAGRPDSSIVSKLDCAPTRDRQLIYVKTGEGTVAFVALRSSESDQLMWFRIESSPHSTSRLDAPRQELGQRRVTEG